jgi:hypothetical protein
MSVTPCNKNGVPTRQEDEDAEEKGKGWIK